MTIKKGEPWGEPIMVPIQTRDVDSDRDLAQGSSSDIHILRSGDIYQALGQPRVPVIDQTRTVVSIDALQCTVTTTHGTIQMLAASSITVGHWRTPPWKRGRFVCLTNGGVYHGKNIAPKAHPNDAVLDVVEISAEIPWRQRLQSYRRAEAGDHIPHPFISVFRGTSFDTTCQKTSECLRIDSHVIKGWASIHVEILPDYWKVIV